MFLRMQRHASRADSAFHQFLMRVPRDVASRVKGRRIELEFAATDRDPAVPVAFKLGTFAKSSLHTRDAATADIRRLALVAHLSRVYEAARRDAVALSQRETVALAGEVYKMLRQAHQDNPGTPEQWEAWKGFTRAALEGRLSAAPELRRHPQDEESVVAGVIFGDDLTAGIDALPRTGNETALAQRCGRLALWVLQKHGIEVDRASNLALLREVAKAALQAGWQAKREAAGDYRPDPLEGRFPANAGARKGITFAELFDRWKAETKPAPSTITTWRGVVSSLTAHLGHDDVARLTADDVLTWKDKLVTGKDGAKALSAKTVSDTYLAALRAILAYAVANRLITENAAKGIKVASKKRAGERRLPYDDSEITRLLKLSEAETHPARRWLPWLAVYTGARIGELAQAWGSQVREIDGIMVLAIEPSPDGGTLKNAGSERLVPLHPALIEAGFAEFAKACGHAPMFYRRATRPGSESRHPSKGTSNHLATWIREKGFTDPRKAPNHASRHWWKSTASRAGVSDFVADAIQGHSDRSSAGVYRHLNTEQLRNAVASIRVPT